MIYFVHDTMDYTSLCDEYEKLEKTTKRLEKTLVLAAFLRTVPAAELEQVMLLLQGLVYPSWDDRKLGFSSNYVIKALALVAGVSADSVKELWRETGDLGNCAYRLLGKKKQATLMSKRLTIAKVFHNLRALADTAGEGSVDTKVQHVAELLSSATGIESKFILRTVLDELRVGLGEGTLRDALVWAFLPGIVGISVSEEEYAKSRQKKLSITSLEELRKIPVDDYSFIFSEDETVAREAYSWLVARVRHALDVCNDFAVVAHALKEKGLVGLKHITLTPGVPLNVMLALKEETMSAAFERVGIPTAVEYKLDGFRMQIHKVPSGAVTLFTRRLENVTAQFPDVVAAIKKSVDGKSFILDSEAVGLDTSTGKFLPFQAVSQRIKRKYDIEKTIASLPVELHVFDVLYHDGQSFLKMPFAERHALVKKIVHSGKGVKVIEQLLVENESAAEKFYKKSLAAGNEGIMFKKLDAPYKPGARVGYMVKMKPVMETLDLVIVAAEWGEGKRSSWLSSYTIACRDSATGELRIVGKVSTGLKEKKEEGLSFGDMTLQLKPLILEQKGRDVTVKPQIVIELNYEEIQKSPSYSSGFALRFPRVVRLREDRDASSCSTLEDVERLFRGQK